MKEYNILHILECNGWRWLHLNGELLSQTTEYTQYKMDILGGMYASTIVAIIADKPEHLDLDGSYGVLWLEAIYECERGGCLSYEDMEDMQMAIDSAEENLLKIGMTFVPTYKFHGRNKANKKRRNDKLRRMYNLEEKEKEDWK